LTIGCDEDEAVELRDLLLPALGDRILRRRPGVRRHFIEERHREVAQIDDFGLDIVALGGNVVNPVRRLVAKAGSSGGADDDGDLEFGHGTLYLG
jgi:hypothetical protein